MKGKTHSTEEIIRILSQTDGLEWIEVWLLNIIKSTGWNSGITASLTVRDPSMESVEDVHWVINDFEV